MCDGQWSMLEAMACLNVIEEIDKIKVKGQLHSRTYKKILPDGELEFRTAHEGVVTEFEVL